MLNNEPPKAVKGFTQHGVVLKQPTGADQWVGDCVFCGKGGHFYVNTNNRLWDCKRCRRSGNFEKFLALVSEKNERLLDGKPLRDLCKDRGIRPGTARAWHVGWDGEFYTMPALSLSGEKVMNLIRFKLGRGSGWTAGQGSFLVGMEHLEESTGPIWLCEGEWDAAAWSEVLKRTGNDDAIALGKPGSTFKPEWASLFQGRPVICGMDNDDAGREGDNKVFEALRNVAGSLQFVHWPEQLPDGYDLRDLFKDHGIDAYDAAVKMLSKEPRYHHSAELRREKEEKEVKLTGKGLSPETVYTAYRKWLKFTHTEVLDVLYGTLFANRIPGDPIWLFLIAPPGGSKTVHLMALDKAPLLVTTTTLTPHALVSGAVSADGGDPSLIPRLKGKVLIIKDFTTIMNMNQVHRDEIFGTLRDAYDGKTEKSYGHGPQRSYNGCFFGLIAGVTPRIDVLDHLHASLGERFIKYRVPGFKGHGSVKRLIKEVILSISKEQKISEELQKVAAKTLNRPITEYPTIPEPIVDQLVLLAEVVALTRAVVVRERWSGEVLYQPTPEIGTRLAKQFAKLAMGIALFRKQDKVDGSILRLVKKVALDTIPGRTQFILRHMFLRRDDDPKWFSISEISDWVDLPYDTVQRILEDLRLLKVVVTRTTMKPRKMWALSPMIVRLMTPLKLYERDERWRRQAREGKRLAKRVR